MKIAILSDIHANIVALMAVLKETKKQSCQRFFILGDMIGYYYEPKAVIDLLRGLPNVTFIRGNHENMFLHMLEEPSFSEIYYQKYGSGLNKAFQQLTEADVAWLQSLSDKEEIELDDVKFGLFHGSELDPNEYIYPDVTKQKISSLGQKYNFTCMGHTHYPVTFIHKNTISVNPGSVGQPRDVGSLASYAIINTENFAITHHRILFDSKALCLQIAENDPHCPYLYEILKRNNIHVDC